MRAGRSGALAFVLALLGWAWLTASPAFAQALESLTIKTASGEHVYQVEIARTEAEHARGLMFRRYMPEDRGMLFEFGAEEPVTFWMKNTYIPLDMIFITRKGVVTRIAANAEPLSEALIPSGGPCAAVLELNGGVAAKIGLQVGDTIKASYFKP